MKYKIGIKLKELKRIILNVGYMFGLSWKSAKAAFFITPLSIIVDSVYPFVFLIIPKYIIDELGDGKRWDIVLYYIALLIIITVIMRALRYLIWFLSHKVWMYSSKENAKRYMSLSLFMDYKNLEDSDIKDIGKKVESKINPSNFITDTIGDLIVSVIQLIGYTYIIFQLHPLMIVAILIIIRFNSVLSRKREKLGYDFQPIVANFARKCDYIYSTMIGFDSGKDIRINKASGWLNDKFNAETDAYLKSFITKQNKEYKLSFWDNVINAAQTLIMYGYSVMMVIAGKITIGSFSVFIGAITNFTSCFTKFLSNIIGIKFLAFFVDDYRNYVKIAKPSYPSSAVCEINFTDSSDVEIEFSNVSFRYPNTDRDVLMNVSLKIKKGEKLSIVGFNGAGKTTFIKLLCRLYTPTEGRILLNGIDIQTIDYSVYRNLIAVVFQDYQLFAFSVEENILLDKTLDEKKLDWAVEKSGLSEKIRSLPNGLNTSISKEFDSEGIEFSGGESQKLACARAYYKDSPVVILDEPTASLDPIAENLLYERFNSIMTNKTSIYISHRLASVKFCDKVAVFENGRIAEYGTHSSLMEENGIYAKMFSTQAEYYKKEASLS